MSLITWLRSSQGFWEAIEYAGEAIVLIGVYLEYKSESIGERNALTAVVMGMEGETGQEISFVTKTVDAKRKRAARKATWILILGLFISLVGMITTSRLSDSKIAELNREAEQAKKDVSIADEHAAFANQRAAELAKQVHDEEVRNFRMELPRSFFATGSDAGKLNSFQGQAIDIMVCKTGFEPTGFAATIAFALQSAKWQIREWDVSPESLGIFNSGFVLTVKQGANAKSCAAAAELKRQLRACEYSWSKLPSPEAGFPELDRDKFFPANGELKYGLESFELNRYLDGPEWHTKNAATIRLIITEKPW